ncbi:MAG: hypothetical protein GSR78_04590 [Desulfurococcales archaeon]|nr:hypothetical protein [Desulfurococcales archaeon]
MSSRGIGSVTPLLMLTLLAVGMLGGALALWWERLTVDIYVETGELDAQLSVHDMGDNEIDIATDMGEPDPTVKDVSDITCTLSDDGKTVFVTVQNAYPSITYYCVLDLTNTGTIPLKIYDVSFSGNLTDVAADFYFDPYTDGQVDFQNGTQIHPGESVLDMLIIHLSNDAQENSVYTATIDIVVEQWNEWPTPPPSSD